MYILGLVDFSYHGQCVISISFVIDISLPSKIKGTMYTGAPVTVSLWQIMMYNCTHSNYMYVVNCFFKSYFYCY